MEFIKHILKEEDFLEGLGLLIVIAFFLWWRVPAFLAAALDRRAEAIVGEIVRCPQADAARYLEQADGDVKTAILLGFGRSRDEAVQLLRRHGGNLRSAINESKGEDG